jgi:TRAP-type C4-dicarboxylate transport system substrate-binding protein
MQHWNNLSPKMKQWVEDEIEVYSRIHHAAIQKADMEAWGKFEKAGTQINRLPVEDLEKFQRVAVPIWFKWANKDKDAARIFKAQLEVMQSPTFDRLRTDTALRARACTRAREIIEEFPPGSMIDSARC